MRPQSHTTEVERDGEFHVVVLLAAGEGSRFRPDDRAAATHKLLAVLPAAGSEPPETVLARSIRHARDAAIGPLVVVTGFLDESELLDDASVRSVVDDTIVFCRNPRWTSGQASSLRVGIDAAADLGATAATVGLADQPFIPADTWRRVAEGLGPIRVATYDGKRGNPVRLRSDIWKLLPADGDRGARVLMRQRPELVTDVPTIGSFADIDTVEDLRRWQSS